MKIVFLGTGSMQPTRERNLSSIYFNHDSEHILFDCGEGTQRQMKIAEIKATNLTRVFLSHFHADHVLGLGGMLRNLDANQYNKTLYVYGPEVLKKFFDNMVHSAYYGNGINVKLMEFKDEDNIDCGKFTIEITKLNHSVPSYGFVIQEKDKRKINLEYTSKFRLTKNPILGELQKGNDIVWEGKKITVSKGTKLVKGKRLGIIWDTEECTGCLKIGKDADLLICESTFSDNESDKAKEYKHLTSKQAANIARRSKAKRLVLTHFSQRYKKLDELKKEAQTIFKNTECAEDFKEIEI